MRASLSVPHSQASQNIAPVGLLAFVFVNMDIRPCKFYGSGYCQNIDTLQALLTVTEVVFVVVLFFSCVYVCVCV